MITTHKGGLVTECPVPPDGHALACVQAGKGEYGEQGLVLHFFAVPNGEAKEPELVRPVVDTELQGKQYVNIYGPPKPSNRVYWRIGDLPEDTLHWFPEDGSWNPFAPAVNPYPGAKIHPDMRWGGPGFKGPGDPKEWFLARSVYRCKRPPEGHRLHLLHVNPQKESEFSIFILLAVPENPSEAAADRLPEATLFVYPETCIDDWERLFDGKRRRRTIYVPGEGGKKGVEHVIEF